MIERGNTATKPVNEPNVFAFDRHTEADRSETQASPWNLLSLADTNFNKTAPAESFCAATGDGHKRHQHESTAKADLKKDLPAEKDLRDGDIIFVSNGAFDEGKAIQIVSKSPMTHCGVLFKEGSDWYVYEAVQPVKKTLLKDFHKTDDGETYAVRRLKNADDVLKPDALNKLHEALKSRTGKDYDHLFGWGDDKLYCSELVWKSYYEATKLKIGKIKMVGDFDLTDPLVKKLVEQRYGKNVPITEPTITPGGIFDSRLLKTVR